MIENTDRQIDVLQALSVVCDRFSHSIRTHLGVSLGLVDDLIAGYSLTETEYQEAKRALLGILATLESVRELTSRPSFEPVPVSLRDFLLAAASTRFGLGERPEFSVVVDGDVTIPLDENLLTRAFRCLLLYGLGKQPTSRGSSTVFIRAHTLEEQPSGVLSESSSRERLQFELEIAFPSVTEDRAFRRIPKGALSDLIECDHSAASLGLLFADRVLQLHGIKAHYMWRENGELRFYFSV